MNEAEFKEQARKKLKEGEILCVWRKDDPALAVYSKWEAKGKVRMWVEQIDEQSSVMKVQWIPKKERKQGEVDVL